MWKKIASLVVFLFLLVGAEGSHSSHLKQLKAAFPYGLLGDDFGLLSLADLAINECHAQPEPFSNKFTSYIYWQCFETKHARLFCDGNGYDEDEKTRMTAMVVAAEEKGILNEYLPSRAIPLADCKAFERDWNRLIKGEKHVCVAGAFTSREKKEPGGKEHVLWHFDRYKSKKGCDSYFVGGCSLKHQLANSCISDRKATFSTWVHPNRPSKR